MHSESRTDGGFHHVTENLNHQQTEDGLTDLAELSAGELELSERAALRRVAGLSTELSDITEVEYRQLRLERVILVGVWTEAGPRVDDRAGPARGDRGL